MKMRIRCKHCNSELELDSSYENQTIQCSECGVNITVPSAITVVERDEGEIVLMEGSQSLLAYLPNFVVASLMLLFGIPFMFMPDNGMEPMQIPGYILFFLASYLIAKPILIRLTYRYTLTNKMLKVREGIIAKNETSVFLKDIKAVNTSRPFCDAIIGCGTLSVGTAATSGLEVVIKHIHGVKKLKQKIEESR